SETSRSGRFHTSSSRGFYMLKRFFILTLSFTALSAHSQEDFENSENLFSSSFSEIRQHHYVNSQYAFFTVTNLGKRDIDDVVLSLALVDSNNEALSRNAVTDATPGMIWLKSGESVELGVPLDDHPDARTLLTKS